MGHSGFYYPPDWLGESAWVSVADSRIRYVNVPSSPTKNELALGLHILLDQLLGQALGGMGFGACSSKLSESP